ncbi:MAG: PAS domain S-box protein, partial [Planctomycetes bacterium]|nr:PAS domain S-box protein [Planctomycetota bacterium]
MDSKLTSKSRAIELFQSALPAIAGLAGAALVRWAPRPELLVLGFGLAVFLIRRNSPAWSTATMFALAILSAPYFGEQPGLWVDAFVAAALGAAVVAALSTRDSVQQQTKVMSATAAMIARDSRDRQRTEAHRVRREAEYRSLVETSNDLIFSVDALGRWTFLNGKAARQIYDCEPDELIGTPFIDVVHPDCRDEELDKFAALMSGDPQAPYETIHRRRDGESVHLVFNATVIRDAKGRVRGGSGTAADITERVRIEERRRAFEERANQAKRLESLGVMAGGIAHDFNNLLLGVMGHEQLARACLDDSIAIEGHLDAIKTASEEAAELVLQLLAYAGKGRRRVEVLDLSRLVQDLLPVFESRVKERAQLTLKLASNLPVIRGDSTQLGRVVVNLALNASEAVDEGSGTVVISTHFDAITQNVVMEVVDDGRG